MVYSIHNKRRKMADQGLEGPDSDWLERVVHDAAELILSDIDTRTGSLGALEEASVADTVELSKEDLESLRRCNADDPLGLEEATGNYEEGDVEELVHSSEREEEGDQESNRALAFHQGHKTKALSSCVMRVHRGGAVEVVERHQEEEGIVLDEEVWQRLKEVVQPTAELGGGVTALRSGAFHLLVVEHPPYVCIHQHSSMGRAELMHSAMAS